MSVREKFDLLSNITGSGLDIGIIATEGKYNACEVVGITTDAAGIIVFGNKLLGAVGRYVEKNLLDSLLIVFHIIMMVCVL